MQTEKNNFDFYGVKFKILYPKEPKTYRSFRFFVITLGNLTIIKKQKIRVLLRQGTIVSTANKKCII